MFNISSLLNAPKIEKKLKMGSKLMKHPLRRIKVFEKNLLLQFHEVMQCETHITLKVSNRSQRPTRIGSGHGMVGPSQVGS